MKKIAIIGAGELGIQLGILILENTEFEIAGFIDDFHEIGKIVFENYKVIAKISEIESLYEESVFDGLIIGIGYNHMNVRKLLFEKYSNKIPFETIIHKSSIISPRAKIGKGVVLYAGCIIDKNVVIENNVLINLKTVISHDSRIGSHSYLAPGVTISGFVNIGECNFIGTSAVIKDNLTICSENIIGIGSLIVKNIEQKGVYFGNPVKIKYEF